MLPFKKDNKLLIRLEIPTNFAIRATESIVVLQREGEEPWMHGIVVDHVTQYITMDTTLQNLCDKARPNCNQDSPQCHTDPSIYKALLA